MSEITEIEPAGPSGTDRRGGASRVRLRDVAREAGVSTATVSRVINGASTVAPATRALIEDKIRELGFAPSPLAKALNLGRTRTVAAVIPTVDNAIFARFLEALEARLGALGHALVIATSNDDRTLEYTRVRALLEMGAEAVILSGASQLPALGQLAARFQAPVVLSSIYDAEAAYPTIGYDNAGLAAQAMAHLVGLGHRQIAVLHGPLAGNDRTRLRLAGAEEARGAATLTCHEGALSVEAGARATTALLEAGPRPTALFCLSDVLALGALFALQRAGLDVPGQISVMGFDNMAWATEAVPPLSSVDLPAVEMGAVTAEAIVAHLERGTPITPRCLRASLILRGSTGPAPLPQSTSIG
ncbi:MAG: LacI family DNA-binding transcriptional regulator [Pseudomonadota bacterium]